MPQRIRVIALGLILDDQQRVFVSEGYDVVKQQAFYRALGGGVDFGETSLAALQREFQEEIQAELTHIRHIACIENLFVFNGNPGHELIQLYQCDFVDRKFYQLESIAFSEGESQYTARWIERDRFISKELWLVPEACLKYL